MILLLSGEGAADIGIREQDRNFKPGPMARLIDQLVQPLWNFSPLENKAVEFLSESELNEISRAKPKSLSLVGKKRNVKGTAYFFSNARGLARQAKALEEKEGCAVAAVLFRDTDGTRKTKNGLWRQKVESMQRGFLAEEFSLGVPMVPQPKSEAWLLCAVQNSPYQNCARFEKLSGNDRSPKSAKKVLADQLLHQHRCDSSADAINRLIDAGHIDASRIDMPSYDTFRARLVTVAESMVSHSGSPLKFINASIAK